MEMVLKQKIFSWFDSYNVCDTKGALLFVVKGKLLCLNQNIYLI